MSKKIKLRFTGDKNYSGFRDYGFFWKVGDEHEVDESVAKEALGTYPNLFEEAKPLSKEAKDLIDKTVKKSSKNIKKTSNKKLSGEGDK